MPASSPPPTDRYELSSYPAAYPAAGEQESSYPLLSDTTTPTNSTHARRHSISPKGRFGLGRWWKPLALVATPFVLLGIYAMVHPHVPGLPALPTVKIHTGGPIKEWGTLGKEEDPCKCGETSEGERLCDVYQIAGLRASRAVEGTGARIRRVLQKAREGERLKVGILGGSGEFSYCSHPTTHD